MNMSIVTILAAVFASVFCIATISEGQTMNNQGLNTKQEKIVAIAAFTANGNLQKLKTALNEGLDSGLTIKEINEILVQMYAYAGFPRSLNGISTFMDVVAERKQKNIKDELGKEPNPLPAGISREKYGEKVRSKLSGTQAAPIRSGYESFVPAINTFLNEHLFADIFGRDNLDIQSREIATISALASMEGVKPMLQFHLNGGMNVGLSEAQIRSLISVVESRVGKKEADTANEVLSTVISSRAK